MATIGQLITDLGKWHDAEAQVIYQYLTSENGAMNEAEFAQVSQYLEANEEFADAMTEFMNTWLNQARDAVAELSPCCMAPLFHEACDGCGSATEFVPVCEICGQVDTRQDLMRCTKHEANAQVCFSCGYLEKIAGETMLDDGTTAKLCAGCFNRIEGRN